MENLTATGIRSSDRPARSYSLYRLSYPGPQVAQSITDSIRVDILPERYCLVAHIMTCTVVAAGLQ